MRLPLTVIGLSHPASPIFSRDAAATSIDPVIKLCHIVSVDYDNMTILFGRC